MEKIRVKYHADIDRIEKIAIGDMIDLRNAEEVVMRKGDYQLISLGVSMELPKGYEAWIIPRSSTFRKYGILLGGSVGIVDNSYKGDNDVWYFPAYATKTTIIPKNTRICQFRIVKNQPEIEFEEVEMLGNADRGGLGSTGEN